MTDTVEGIPSLQQLFDAAPDLHWRRCYDCGSEALHVDCVAPSIECRHCTSHDTRRLIEKNQALLDAVQRPQSSADLFKTRDGTIWKRHEVEIWTDGQWWVIPEQGHLQLDGEDDDHDCDLLGCGQQHVIARFAHAQLPLVER